MGGHTGRRARPAGKCIKCGQQIKDAEFMRDKKGDEHMCCPLPRASNGAPIITKTKRGFHIQHTIDPLTGEPWEKGEGPNIERGGMRAIPGGEE